MTREILIFSLSTISSYWLALAQLAHILLALAQLAGTSESNLLA